MNTLYFYTNSVECEQASNFSDCRDYKKILTDNNWPFINIDIFRNNIEQTALKQVIGNALSTPQFIIRDSSNALVTYFSSLDLKRELNMGPDSGEVYLTAAKSLLEEKLIKYQVI